jgi:hypothetical protein
VAAWTSTLRLANLWELARTRADAIAHLDRLITGPAARIRLAREMAISSWQVPALEALVLQEAALTAAPAEQLGLDTILKLAALRETYGSARMSSHRAHLKAGQSHLATIEALRTSHSNAISASPGRAKHSSPRQSLNARVEANER